MMNEALSTIYSAVSWYSFPHSYYWSLELPNTQLLSACCFATLIKIVKMASNSGASIGFSLSEDQKAFINQQMIGQDHGVPVRVSNDTLSRQGLDFFQLAAPANLGVPADCK